MNTDITAIQSDAAEPAVRRVQRLRHPLVRRELKVLRVESPSPKLRSLTLGGPALEGFISASFDDHLKLLLDAGGPEPVRRDYTPRHYDAAAGELMIEFALHGDGPAAAWAAQAEAGQTVAIGGPRGSLVIDLDHDWHLLVGDETALPAIARRLEELPAQAIAIVIGQVDEASEQRQFNTRATLDLRWVANAQGVIEALRTLTLPAGDGFAWCAGEAKAVAAQRRVLVEELGLGKHAVRAAAYWKLGTPAHHENLED